VLKENLEDQEIFRKVLSDAEVPKRLKEEKSSFVYILRLKGQVDALYVGMTGLHPYERYLNHIRGHKAGKVTKKRATAIINFEGPMTHDIAVAREVSMANELREQGSIVHGGH